MIHVHWHPFFTCDGCSAQSQGLKQLVQMNGNIPSIWGAMPRDWSRSYGFDLCPGCTQKQKTVVAATRKANKERWLKKLFHIPQKRVYCPMSETVDALRVANGLGRHPMCEMYEKSRIARQQARAKDQS